MKIDIYTDSTTVFSTTSPKVPLQASDDNSSPAAFILRAPSVSQALPANARLRMQLFADLTSVHVPSTVDPVTGQLVSTQTQVVLFTN